MGASTKRDKNGVTRQTPQRARATKSTATAWYAKFLAELNKCANVTEACAAACVGRATAYQARHRDDDFAKAWDDAIEIACDRLEREAWRRGVEGVEEPVFQLAQKCGSITRYSDKLLDTLLRAHRPEKYRERVDVNHGGSVRLSMVDWLAKTGSADDIANGGSDAANDPK